MKDILDGSSLGLEQYTSGHLDAIEAPDGSYIFDVTVRFSAPGANLLVLVECKHTRRKVERQDVQAVHTKLVSTGAQKAMLFSIAGFRSGALKYAVAHGIALVQLAGGNSTWFTRSMAPATAPPAWLDIPEFVGCGATIIGWASCPKAKESSHARRSAVLHVKPNDQSEGRSFGCDDPPYDVGDTASQDRK